MRFLLVVLLGLALVTAACSSSSAANACPPMQQIVGSGTLEISRSGVVTMYSLTTSAAEDLFNAGALTVRAGDTVGGAGSLAVSDPVVLVKLMPVSDDVATYDLTTLKAQIAYCASASASLVVANGAITGCSSGMPVMGSLAGTLTVTSSTSKTIDPANGMPLRLTAKLGSQSVACD